MPLNWYEVAQLLHENALMLHAMPQGTVTRLDGAHSYTRRASNRPVFLLAAFAMENLLKAYLIYENPSYIEGGKLSRKLLNGHGLTDLHGLCKRLPSPKRTRNVLEVLQLGVNSWARYPCSTGVARESMERAVTDEFWNEYSRVFALYSERMRSLLQKRWSGPYGEVTYVEFHDGSAKA